uniref:Replication protein n=1 Tax=Dependoparvovirus sp. TaxID=2052559 RepID=A0A7D3QL37_9VIRU|nr:MAG: replication protein [Dependoparvovirus sp.]
MANPSYFEFVIRLPADVEEDLPGIPDSFIDWLCRESPELPEGSDLDPEQIEMPMVVLGQRIIKIILNAWRSITKQQDVKYYVQLEKVDSAFHLHVLVETCKVPSFTLGRHVNRIKEDIVRQVYQKVAPRIDDWFSIAKTRGGHKSNKIHSESYIDAYLLGKVQPELQWAWTNIPAYVSACLSLAERQELVKNHRIELGHRFSRSASISSSTGSTAPVIQTKSADRYMALVDWLVENGITTAKQWLQEDKDSYLSFHATGSSSRQVKSALENACEVMSLTKTAADYLIGKQVPEDITQNRIYKLFELNGYDPHYAGKILLGWCKREHGKRNTVWLFGPATTGKTILAEAIAHAVPFFGCVNWTNENFPFNDCVNKMLIWWEEGKMTTKIVESAKAILGGSQVRVDQKCKSSSPIEQTPVIITSNTPMYRVYDGNSTTFEHEKPLKDRMFCFEFLRPLDKTFGKVTKQEVKEFFAWAQAQDDVIVEDSFHVLKSRGVKRSHDCDPLPICPEGAEPKEATPTTEVINISAAAPPSSVDDGTASSADPPPPPPPDSAEVSLYKNKCSRHLALSIVKYVCRDCELLNKKGGDVCIMHNQEGCSQCFPGYEESIEPPVHKKSKTVCGQCHLLGNNFCTHYEPMVIGKLMRCTSCVIKYRNGVTLPPWGDCQMCMDLDELEQ